MLHASTAACSARRRQRVLTLVPRLLCGAGTSNEEEVRPGRLRSSLSAPQPSPARDAPVAVTGDPAALATATVTPASGLDRKRSMNKDSVCTPTRRKVGVFMTSIPMEVFIVFVVILFTILVITEISIDEDTRTEFEFELWLADLVILSVMGVEILLKLFAFGTSFLKNKWNLFDAIVVLASIVLNLLTQFLDSIVLLRIVRLRAVLRLFRLVVVYNRVKQTTLVYRKLRTGRGDHMSPLERTLYALHALADRPLLSEEDRENVEFMIDIISSHRLYTAGDVIGQARTDDVEVDDETQEWLQGQYLNPEAQHVGMRARSMRSPAALAAAREREEEDSKSLGYSSMGSPTVGGASHGGSTGNVSAAAAAGRSTGGGSDRSMPPLPPQAIATQGRAGGGRSDSIRSIGSVGGQSAVSFAQLEQERMKRRTESLLNHDLAAELERMDADAHSVAASVAAEAESLVGSRRFSSESGIGMLPMRRSPSTEERTRMPAHHPSLGSAASSSSTSGVGIGGGTSTEFTVTAAGSSRPRNFELLKTSSRLRLFSGRAVKMQRILEELSNWDFDVFQAAEITGGFPLFLVAYNLMLVHNVLAPFGLDDLKVRRALHTIEAGYLHNPYHNSTHAADVTQTMCYFVSKPFLLPYVTAVEKLAAILAAAIHDYGHPGVNNNFHVAAKLDLAIVYNDRAVLENFHVSSFFQLMRRPEDNLFADMDAEVAKNIRQLIISMVLATDMAVHFDEVAKFKSKLIQVRRDLGRSIAEDEERAAAGGGGGERRDSKTGSGKGGGAKSSGGGEERRGSFIKTAADTDLFMRMALHTADVSNPAKPLHLAQRWTEQVVEEFYAQGDRERELGLPISAFMDRTTGNVPKLQLGFIDFIVKPLFEQWASVMPEVEAAGLATLLEVRKFWEAEQGADAARRKTSVDAVAERRGTGGAASPAGGDSPTRGGAAAATTQSPLSHASSPVSSGGGTPQSTRGLNTPGSER